MYWGHDRRDRKRERQVKGGQRGRRKNQPTELLSKAAMLNTRVGCMMNGFNRSEETEYSNYLNARLDLFPGRP